MVIKIESIEKRNQIEINEKEQKLRAQGFTKVSPLAWIPMLVIRLNTTRTNRSEVVGVFLLTKGSGYLCYGYRQPRAGGCGRVSESER